MRVECDLPRKRKKAYRKHIIAFIFDSIKVKFV